MKIIPDRTIAYNAVETYEILMVPRTGTFTISQCVRGASLSTDNLRSRNIRIGAAAQSVALQLRMMMASDPLSAESKLSVAFYVTATQAVKHRRKGMWVKALAVMVKRKPLKI